MGSKITMWLLFSVTLSHFFTLNNGDPLAPALYVLGDSILDSGNNNELSTTAKVNYSPYGSNFKLGPTGRFTNGKTMADFIAEYLGLPYAPPAMGLKEKNITTGVNYASGSCGILPESGSNMGKCLTLNSQLDMLEDFVKKDLPKLIPAKELPGYLANSIMILSVGSNDYINNYLRSDVFNTSKQYKPCEFAKLLVERLTADLKRVYNMGFRKIVVFKLGDIGCVPAIKDLMPHVGPCVLEVNKDIEYYDTLLPKSLLELTATLKDSNFVLGAGSTLDISGITNLLSPCCKTVKETGLCIKGQAAPPCNVESSYFWDGFHPSQTIYSRMAQKCIYDSTFCTPKSIKDLVQVKVL